MTCQQEEDRRRAISKYEATYRQWMDAYEAFIIERGGWPFLPVEFEFDGLGLA